MGKIQELHALLDDGATESDFPAALRLVSSEAQRQGGPAEGEEMDTARLLLRLSVASSNLKISIWAGRVLGELMVRRGPRVPALAACMLDLGGSVVCLLEAAHCSPTGWPRASLDFSYSAPSPPAPPGHSRRVLLGGKREALSVALTWVSALAAIGRAGGEVLSRPQRAGAALQRAALYRALPPLNPHPAYFSCMCASLAGMAEDGTAGDCTEELAALYDWMERSLRRVCAQGGGGQDTQKTVAALTTATGRLLALPGGPPPGLQERVAVLVQGVLLRAVVPLGPLPPPSPSLEPASPAACVSAAATALLQVLRNVTRSGGLLTLPVETLLRCNMSSKAAECIHSIIGNELASPAGKAAAGRLQEWVRVARREVGLAEQAVRDWLKRHSGIAREDGRMECSEPPNSNSLGSYDLTDVRQLEALLAWDPSEEGVEGAAIPGVRSTKRRRLEDAPAGPNPAADAALGTDNCYHLAGLLQSGLWAEREHCEAVGGIPVDHCGLLSYFRTAVIALLQVGEDCEHLDPSSVDTTGVRLLGELVSSGGLLICMAAAAGATADDGEPPVQSLQSLLFYVFAVSVEMSINVCLQQSTGSALSPSLHGLMSSVVASAARLVSRPTEGCTFGGLSVPQEHVMRLLVRVLVAYDDFMPPPSDMEKGTSELTSGLYTEMLRAAATPHLSQCEALSASFWTDSTGATEDAYVNFRSPFPLLEVMWERLSGKQRLEAACMAMEALLKRASRPLGQGEPFTVPPPSDLVCSEDSQDARAVGPLPVHQDDCLAVACVWVCRAVAAAVSNRSETDPATVLRALSLAARIFRLVMRVVAASFQRCVIVAAEECASLCDLLPMSGTHNHDHGGLDQIMCQFQFLDRISTCGLAQGGGAEGQAAELRRRTLVSELLPAVGALWMAAEPAVKGALSDPVGRSRGTPQHSDPGVGLSTDDMCAFMDFLSASRAVFGIIHCFHSHRGAELQTSSRRVLASMDQLVKESVVSARPAHALCCRVSDTLAVALLAHGAESDELALAASAQSGGKGDSKGGSFLAVFGRMLANASSKAAKLPDEENNPAGEDGRHSLLRCLVPALARVVRCAAVTSPQVSFWALSQLASAWLMHPSSWHWAYQVFYEQFSMLGARRAAGGVLEQLLASDPSRAAESFLIPLIRADSTTLLTEIVEGILSVRPVEEYLRFFAPHVVSTVVLAGDLPCYRAMARRFPRLMFRFDGSSGDYDLSLSSLLEYTPLILYEMLTAKQMARSDEVRMLLHGLPQRLMECTRALRLGADFDIRTAQPPGGRALQRYLLHAVWDTGQGPPRVDGGEDDDGEHGDGQVGRAVKALRVISAVYTTDSWVGGSTDDDSPNNPWKKYEACEGGDLVVSRKAALKEFTADLVPSHFLYIMSHLIQRTWGSQSDHRQEQAVRTVGSLVRLVRPEALSQFLPKVVVALDAALCSPSARVRAAGALLAEDVCLRLPPDVLQANASALLVGLFPIIEGSIGRSSHESERVYMDFKNSFSRQTDAFPAACIVDSELPKITGLIAELAFYDSVEATLSRAAFTVAVRTLLTVCAADREDCAELLAAIPYIPDAPLLEELRVRHRQLIEETSLDQSVLHLCAMLRHDSSQVRVTVLRRLLSAIRESRSLLFATELEGHSSSRPRGVLSTLVASLLALCARENDSAAKEACARCLGEIGAVDPARVSVQIVHSSPSVDNVFNVITGRDSTSSSAGGVPPSLALPPWEFNVWSLGLFLLHEHLMPALRAASGAGDVAAQDFSGLAVQEVLHILAESLGSDTPTTGKDMPAALTKVLRDLQILDVTEPFWSTKYNLEFTRRANRPDLYRSCPSFSAWISSWCLQLICCSESPFEPLFRACRGAVRHRPELGQFLLPYLIVDAVGNSKEESEGVCARVVGELQGVLGLCLGDSEMNIIERTLAPATTTSRNVSSGNGEGSWGSGDEIRMSPSSRPLAVQSVFGLLDQLGSWTVRAVDSRRRGKPASETDSTGSAELSKAIVSRICAAISADLLGRAALSVKAYARSARYFEISAREVAAAPRGVGGGGDSVRSPAADRRRVLDGANGELPVLSTELLDTLLVIFAQLDDTDAVSGVQTGRHLHGIASTPWNRIVELQQTDRWLDALREYDLLQLLAGTGVGAFSHRVNRMRAESYLEETEENTEETQHSLLVEGMSPATGSVVESQEASEGPDSVYEDGDDVVDGDASIPCDRQGMLVGYVERGKLRCLMEMGHTKLAFDEWSGVNAREPSAAHAVYSLGVEAACRLQEWGRLEEMLDPAIAALPGGRSAPAPGARGVELAMDDMLTVSSGHLLLALRRNEKVRFAEILSAARQRVMSFLSAASMESYSRCYPALVQLHLLQELEQGGELCGHGNRVEGVIRGDLGWDSRLSLLSPSFKQRSKVLAARRAVLGILEQRSLVAENWLECCSALRVSGRFDTAMIALRHAEANGLGPDRALLEEGMLVKDSGDTRRALMLVEPDESVLARLKIISQGPSKRSAIQSVLEGQDAEVLANRLLLATRWIAEGKLAHGREILDRFKVVLLLRRDWEDALFYLAKYNDDLFEAKYKAIKQRGQLPGEEDKAMLQLAVTALDNYGRCMKVGSKYIMQAAPKLLSVFFNIMGLRGEASGIVGQAQRAMSTRAAKFMTEISPCLWYTCMPQLVSRVGHPSPDALRFVKGVLHAILVSYPEQGVWHISSLLHSLNKERAAVGRALVRDAVVVLEKKRKYQSSVMLQESVLLFSNLVELAQSQPKERRIRWSIGTECELTNFMVPSQAALSIVFPSAEGSGGHEAYFPSGAAYFQSFDCSVEVMMTKAKPKKISAVTTAGTSVRFLLKQERFGDLRKDARLMEFNAVVNRLLQEGAESRKRNLRLRTFCVVCLNEECGIMEWVPNTAGLRSLVYEAHARSGDQYPYLDLRRVKDSIEGMQAKYVENNLEELLAEYRRTVLDNYRPCFHKWFLTRFTDPAEWLEARDRFTRSSAVWASVGHVVGLGDRHGDNIMLDVQLGECVHVDFDCLFDKGLKLQRPEIVPFRLSPSMVDAMGIFGYEGTFRRSMEVCLGLLRTHKDTLIGVLEPFISDPTVAWGRGGRAQQREGSLTNAPSTGAGFQDAENKDAEYALLSISERLCGIYNIAHPKAVKITNAYRSQGRPVPKIGLAASQEDALNLPLSVEGQVDRLIAEATAEINLAQMYHGWMPWS